MCSSDSSQVFILMSYLLKMLLASQLIYSNVSLLSQKRLPCYLVLLLGTDIICKIQGRAQKPDIFVRVAMPHHLLL